MKYKLDLHTHSVVSPDGGLTDADYKQALASGRLDVIAVTDHNTISFARQLREEIGEQIIVGEEITTQEGEIIGLFLQESIESHLSAAETVKRIKAQKGLVYIPHPFETVRKGVNMDTLLSIAAEVDIIEVHNGRAVFQNTSEASKEWSIRYQVPGAAGSDAHSRFGLGKTYCVVGEMPTKRTLGMLLHEATYNASWPGVPALLAPKYNRLRKWLKGNQG